MSAEAIYFSAIHTIPGIPPHSSCDISIRNKSPTYSASPLIYSTQPHSDHHAPCETLSSLDTPKTKSGGPSWQEHFLIVLFLTETVVVTRFQAAGVGVRARSPCPLPSPYLSAISVMLIQISFDPNPSPPDTHPSNPTVPSFNTPPHGP